VVGVGIEVLGVVEVEVEVEIQVEIGIVVGVEVGIVVGVEVEVEVVVGIVVGVGIVVWVVVGVIKLRRRNQMNLSIPDLCELLLEMNQSGECKSGHPFAVGQNYLIRTVTMTVCGCLSAVYPNELVLECASWIADTGRFADALRDVEKLSEIEPFPGQVIVGRGAIVDACCPTWDKLPTIQK